MRTRSGSRSRRRWSRNCPRRCGGGGRPEPSRSGCRCPTAVRWRWAYGRGGRPSSARCGARPWTRAAGLPRARRRGDVPPGASRLHPGGRRAAAGRPGHRRRQARRAGDQVTAARAGQRRAVRHRLRRPPVPASPGRRAGTAGQPDRVAGRPRRLPGHLVPARTGDLLRAPGPPDGRSGAGSAPAPGGVHRRMPGHSGARRLGRPRPGAAGYVLPGGPLFNNFRGQTGSDGRLALPGLIFVGDAVATTTPTFGRGVSTTLMQAGQLLRLLDEHGADTGTAAETFDAWCTEQIRPWVDDHVRMDEATRRRWAGQDVDLDRPLPSDLILAAGRADPGILGAARGYLTMTELPSSLRAVEPRARALYASGWRPDPAPGPGRDELAGIIRVALRATPTPTAQAGRSRWGRHLHRLQRDRPACAVGVGLTAR